MKLQINLATDDATINMLELNDYTREQNLKGIITEVPMQEAKPGEQSAADYLPVIQMALGSTVVAAGVKGLFDVLKNYFELKKQEMAYQLELEKAKLEAQKISLSSEKPDGTKAQIQLSTFDEQERKRFSDLIDQHF